MANTLYAIEYLGAITATQGKMYNSSDIKTAFPTATVLKMKTKEGGSVSVNGSDMFPIDYNDENYLATGHTYIFERDCIIAVGRYVNIS